MIDNDCEDGEGDEHENVEVEDESVEKQRNDPPNDIVVQRCVEKETCRK